jgi:hypothetical protein
MKKSISIAIFLLLAIPLLAQPPSQNEIARMLQPQSEQFALTASVRQAWGMRLNPASIGKMYGVNLMYNVYEEKGKLLEHEIMFQNYLFNFSWRRALSSSMEYRVDHFSFSMGSGRPEFLAGGSFQWISSDLPENDHGVFWSIGTLMTANEYLTIALTKRNMNQPVIGGVTVQGVQSIGAVVKPFKNSERLVIALDYTLANHQRVRDGSITLGVDGRILKNLRLYGFYDHHMDAGNTIVMVGVRFAVPYFGFGLNSAFQGLKTYTHSVASVLFSPEPKGVQY